eukprot:Sdes_comp18486_c0_seq1m8481
MNSTENSRTVFVAVADVESQIPQDKSQDKFSDSFIEKSVRLAFIRKVYGILFVQLLLTFSVVAVFVQVEEIKSWVRGNFAFFIGVWVGSLVTIIIIVCCGRVARVTPYNYLLLLLFTLCESVLVGVISAYYDIYEILIAFGITIFIVVGLTLYAKFTTTDFTTMGGFLCVFCLCLFAFGILTFFFQNRILSIVYSSLGALLFGFFLVFDTQLIMGSSSSSTRRFEFSPEDYVLAALHLYLDIIMIFINILSLVHNSK